MSPTRRFFRGRVATLGAAILAIVFVLALLAPWLMPHDPFGQDLMRRLQPPLTRSEDGLHLFGTDALGRDILSRLMTGARISLLVGVAAMLVSGGLGVLLGLIMGWDEGWLGRLIMGLTDLQLAVPFLVLALAVVAVLGPSLLNVILVLGATGWVQYARVVRAECLVLREREFVLAARSLGASAPRILWRHLLPNVMSSVIVISGLQVAKMILLESSLSFLGLGVPPSIPTWGGMIADGRDYVANAWWVAAIPGFAIFLTVVSINLVGDRLRDILDPKLKQVET